MEAFGQTLNDGASVYSPWFARQADNAYIYVEGIDRGTSGSLTVTVYHKSLEDTSETGTTATGWSTSLGVERGFINPTGLKELVRLKFAVTTAWVRCRTLGIMWYDTATGS